MPDGIKDQSVFVFVCIFAEFESSCLHVILLYILVHTTRDLKLKHNIKVMYWLSTALVSILIKL